MEHRELYSMFGGVLNGKEVQKRGDKSIRIAYSLCYTVETNNIVKQIYSNKNKKKKLMVH